MDNIVFVQLPLHLHISNLNLEADLHLSTSQQQLLSTMLPPVDPGILSANPQFDALYRDLCSNRLEADGTTKIDPKAQKERDAFKGELRKARVSAAKQNLIKSYLSALSYQGDDLPSEVCSHGVCQIGRRADGNIAAARIGRDHCRHFERTTFERRYESTKR